VRFTVSTISAPVPDSRRGLLDEWPFRDISALLQHVPLQEVARLGLLAAWRLDHLLRDVPQLED
jgi:hypothetical protein